MNDAERILPEKQFIDHCHKCRESLSWTAVVAGALVATGLSFLLNIFDIGIGLTVVKHTQEGVRHVVLGGLLGMLIGAIVTMFVAGWVSGYIARPYCRNQHLGVLHGFTTWCLALIITLVFLATNVGFLSYSSHLLANNAPNTIVELTTDGNAPAMSRMQSSPPQVTINAEKSANEIGKGALAAFLIFFLSAVASCFGGYCGSCRDATCCEKKEPDRNRTL